MTDDLNELADLSHDLDRRAQNLCRTEDDDLQVERALAEAARGEKEALAVALSYALRRRELEGSTHVNDRAVAALAATLRRMNAEEA